MATPMRTRSLAFRVASAGFCMCTQEQCSLKLTNSKRYLLSPARSQFLRKSISWVRGVQEATTTLFSLSSLILFLIEESPSSEQV